jgi:hypothetical protein
VDALERGIGVGGFELPLLDQPREALADRVARLLGDRQVAVDQHHRVPARRRRLAPRPRPFARRR